MVPKSQEGLPRRRVARTASEPVIVTSETSDAGVGGTGVVDPATVRPRLAEAAAEGLDGIRRTLLDAAPARPGITG
jgi:hypothetical protein